LKLLIVGWTNLVLLHNEQLINVFIHFGSFLVLQSAFPYIHDFFFSKFVWQCCLPCAIHTIRVGGTLDVVVGTIIEEQASFPGQDFHPDKAMAMVLNLQMVIVMKDLFLN
jgi:hypothetical protein